MIMPQMSDEIRDLILFFKIISDIKSGDKYNFGDGKFVSSQSSYWALYRCWNGENRTDLINNMEKRYDEAWECLSDPKEMSVYKNLLVDSIKSSRKGICNLMETYTGDNKIVGRLSILKDKIDIWSTPKTNLHRETNDKKKYD
jgi:hypothetical protein